MAINNGFSMRIRGGMMTIIAAAAMAFLTFSMLYSNKHNGRVRPVAVKGVMDLRDWDFNRDGPVQLSGEWGFAWNRLIPPHGDIGISPQDGFMEVPGIWNGRIVSGQELPAYGCASYFLKLLLPDRDSAAVREKLGIKVLDLGTAYSLFINGSPAGAGGVVGESADKASPGYWPDVVEATADSGTMDILLHVSNYHHRKGGAWETIVAGPLPMLHAMRERNIACDFFLFGSIFLMGAYHLVLFSLRKKDRSYIYFGIFCMLIAMRVLVTGEYYAVRLVPVIPWEGILKMEYLSFYAGVPAFFLFVHSLFPDEFSRRGITLTVTAGIIFCCIVITTSTGIYSHTMVPYQALSAGICCYGLFALCKAVAGRREGAIPFISGFLIMFAALLNDFLHNNLIIRTGYLVPCGLVLFIFLKAFLLSRRFSRTLCEVEGLTIELEMKNRKLVDMDAMKNEFLATVSHELRTPLNGIIGIAEAMVEGRSGMVSLESRFSLGLVIASARRLASLVNDLLDFARLNNSDIALDLGPVDIKALADVVLSFVRPLVGTKNLALINAIVPGGPLAHADENRIQQVLYNLAGNAVKFTSSGSVVIGSRAFGRDGWMEISVSDTGTGIDPDRLRDIFDHHERTEGARSHPSGAGMGLLISKKLVELHGGSIEVEPARGGGSVFTFTLPVWQAGKEDRHPASVLSREAVMPEHVPPPWHFTRHNQDSDAGERGRILVVDDDIINLQVMLGHLTGDGFQVKIASSGKEALETIRQGPLDLVLLDLMMPGMSGLELCVEVRKRFSLVELPVVILTARYGITDLVAGFERGANDYLTKPIDRQELLARVRTLVALKRTVRDNDEAKYKLLQERMNPHFLFNSLNTVHSLIGRDRSLADRAVIMLADNYRFLIDYSFLSLIPFDTEWEFVEKYLELERLRFGDIMTSVMNRSGEFSSVRIPPLTLQPLVENALKHGIRKSGSPGTVRIDAEEQDGKVRITVSDNGAGPGPGIGDLYGRSLGNIRKRLNHYHHDVELILEGREEGGSRVRLSFLCGSEKISFKEGAAV